jgi:uncharacterized protein (TIGR00369 family)
MAARSDPTTFTPADPQFAQRVKDSFAQQPAMHTLGVSLEVVEPGFITLRMPFSGALTQHNGFIHAGIITTALDSACGFAAFSLMPATKNVLSIEFKTNLLAPAKGREFLFEGRVLKAGRTITVCEGRAFDISGGAQRLVASMTATMIAVDVV